jgi:hypothetical protein
VPLVSMAQWYKFVLYYLWIAPHIILAFVAIFTYVRRLHKKYPIFFTYTLYETIVFVLLYSYRGTLAAAAQNVSYRYIFLVTLAGSTALRFGVIQEIFRDLFHAYTHVENLAAAVLWWVGGFLVLISILFVVYSSGTIPENLTAGVALLARSVAMIQVGLLIFCFLFSGVFGLSWRSYAFGIALGFAIFASADLAMWALRLAGFSTHFKLLLNLLPTGSYHVSVLVWLGYLLAVEKPLAAAIPEVREIDQWSGELESLR